MEAVGKYYGDLRVACGRGKLLVSVLIAGWLSWPVAVATMFHPTDAIGFQFWLQNVSVPRFYTWHQATAGVIDASATLGCISIVMLGATVLFYRRAQIHGEAVAGSRRPDRRGGQRRVVAIQRIFDKPGVLRWVVGDGVHGDLRGYRRASRG